jgi:hypothetical protein
MEKTGMASRRQCCASFVMVGSSKHAASSAFDSHKIGSLLTVANRWDEKAGLRRDAIRSQVINALEGARDKGDRQWRRLAL